MTPAGNKTWLWWSSGKDSTWALHRLRAEGRYAVDALVTSFNVEADRVAMHAVRSQLVRAQANALDLPLRTIELPYPCPNGAYEEAAARLVADAEREGVTHMAFGDLYLEDVRAYRESLLASSPIEPIFPLWGIDTGALSRTMVDGGVVAHVTCVDPRVLDPSFAGRTYDHAFLEALPDTVDPCGEGGEFHTFVSDGPGFAHPVGVAAGEVVRRDGFVFADLVSNGSA